MILVLGATGMFGSRVVRETAALGAPVRALAHSRAHASVIEQYGVEIVDGNLDRPDTLGAAFAGVETAFIVTPMDDRIQEREANALNAAKASGVKRVVKLYGAVRHRGDALDKLHSASIDAIKESGLAWALVSPNSVMETSLLSQAEGVKQANSLFGCAGEGRVGLVAADDVGRAAAVVLTDRDEDGRNYELTGPQALTMGEMASALSAGLGREVRYTDMPEQEFRKLMVEEAGVPVDEVEVAVMLHFAAWKRGDANLVTDTYRELTGAEPMSLGDWVVANRSSFDALDG